MWKAPSFRYRDRKDSYSAFSAKVATLYRDHGALRIIDRWLDEASQESEANHAEGSRASREKTSEVSRDARTIAGAKPNEVLMLSWVEWPDEATRDAGVALALADPRLQLSHDDWVIFEGRSPIGASVMMILDRERS